MQSGAPVPKSFLDGATDFLVWWRDELRGLLPERMVAPFARGGAKHVLTQVDGGFQIMDRAAARGADAASPGLVLSYSDALARLAQLAAARTATEVGIRLPLSQCFVRRVELPAAARSDMRQILNFDLERATPFKLKDVYTAHVVDSEGGPRSKLRISQIVAKREAVDRLVADVQLAGLDVAFVDCWREQPGMGLGVDLLQQGTPEGAVTRGFFTPTRVLGSLAILLIATAAAITLTRHEFALADLKERAARTRVEAATVRDLFERSKAAVASLARLQAMKLEQVTAIEALEEMSRLLPDTVWLNDFRLEGDTLDITGLAKSGASLVALFQHSTIFVDPTLTSPLTFDQREDKERFSLRVRVKQPASLRQAAKEEPQ